MKNKKRQPTMLQCGDWLVPYGRHCINCWRVHFIDDHGGEYDSSPTPREWNGDALKRQKEATGYNLAMWERAKHGQD